MPHHRAPVLAAGLALALALSGPGAAALPHTGSTAPAGEADAQEATHLATALEPTLSPQAPAPETAQALETTPATLTGTVDTPDGVTVVGLVWEGEPSELDALTGEVVGADAQLRVRRDGAWGQWQGLGEALPMDEAGQRWATDATVVVDADDVQVELRGDVSNARVETWTSAVTSEDAARVAALPPVPAGAATLPVGTRADWGADESLRTRPVTASTPKLGVTLHHTVTAPVYAPEEVPATLRAIHGYHARTLGWGDIGYHMFVDQHGRLWEGRAGGIEKNVQGAHAVGMNTDWFGLSVIGDHETQPVAPSQHTSITAPAAWVMNVHGADAGSRISYTNRTRGWTRTLPVFHGHQDVDATLCPGFHLIALMVELREKIVAEQALERTAVQRIGGMNRYEVAAGMAREAFREGTSVAYVASGEGLADALGVGPLAHQQGAAVLLAKAGSVPSVTLSALRTLGVREVRLVGGEVALTPAVEQTLRGAGFTVTRMAGDNRYATAVRLAEQSPSDTVYLANGSEPADALGAAAAAAEIDADILLTKTDALPDVTARALARLAPSRIVVLGGEMAVSNRALERAAALVPSAQVDRLGGTNRYATSALVARDAFGSADSAVVANAWAPADAMVGTQVAARHGAPLLLTSASCRSSAVATAYDRLGIELTRLAGGPGVLDWTAGSTRC